MQLSKGLNLEDKHAGRSKIAYMLGTFPGLTETFVIREIEGLKRHGFEVNVFAVKRAGLMNLQRSLLSQETLANTVFARPDYTLRLATKNMKSLILHPFRYLAALKIFAGEALRLTPAEFIRLMYHFFCGIGFLDELRRRGITNMHCHFASGTNMALAANLFSGMPFSFTAHATGDIYMNPVLLKKKMERASFVVPCCEYNKRYLDDVTGFAHSEKLCRIYSGVDINEAKHLAVEMGKETPSVFHDARDLQIVSVGSLIVMKGHATLIEACAILKEKGHAIRCEIIGEGAERKNLERLINRAGMGGRIRLAGPQPLSYIYEALGRADIFALLSKTSVSGYRDGMPIVILEAMAMGLPVVSTYISGIPEMVVDGVTGFLIHERDAAGAANAIERLIADAEFRKQFGEAGRKRVRDLFLIDRMINQLAELFSLNSKGSLANSQ